MTAAWLMLGALLCSLQLNTGSFPRPLSEEEERHYLTLAKEGDLEARNILIERNLRLVAHIMKKYYTHASDQEDLISIGTIGLIKGIETFDSAKGARLATYAARCVENATLTPPRHSIKIAALFHKNRPAGGCWTGFQRKYISYPPTRKIMCGMRPLVITGLICALRTSWNPLQKMHPSVSGCVGSERIKVCGRQMWPRQWGFPEVHISIWR